MDDKQLEKMLREISRASSLPRKHANFFNWHDKEIKELDIATYLAGYLSLEEKLVIKTLKACELDPPDCVLITESCNIAIEIVELVDSSAIQKQIKEGFLYPEQDSWTEEKLEKALNELITIKDNPRNRTSLHKEYPRYVLLLHTDEPELNINRFKDIFKPSSLIKSSLISEIYLLFSYHPETGNCPILRLR